jgi:Fe-S cluster biosynthesis and repair protein YggX
MSRTVFCSRYQQTLEGLDQPPFPGPKGEKLFTSVSKQAWQDWLDHQTRLINEKQLNTSDFQNRKYLMEQMDKFFSGEEFDQAEGYVPVEEATSPDKE